jgi:hypothetical protein
MPGLRLEVAHQQQREQEDHERHAEPSSLWACTASLGHERDQDRPDDRQEDEGRQQRVVHRAHVR